MNRFLMLLAVLLLTILLQILLVFTAWNEVLVPLVGIKAISPVQVVLLILAVGAFRNGVSVKARTSNDNE